MFQWLDGSLYVALPYGLVTLSMVLTFQYLRWADVTCASTFVLGAAFSALSIVYWGFNPYAALALAACAGALGGGVTAFFHLALRIDKLLSGILSAFAVYSVNLLILKPTIPYALHTTALSYWEKIDIRLSGDARVPLHLGSIAFLIGVVVLAKVALDAFLASELGLCLRALEDEDAGPAALRRRGIAPWKIKTLGVVAGNAMVGVAGGLVSMAEGAANAHRGFDVLITGLIAYLIGSKMRDWIRIPSRRQRVSYTSVAIFGPVVYFAFINLAHRTNLPPEFAKIAIAVYVAVTIGDKAWLGLARGRAMQKGLPTTFRHSGAQPDSPRLAVREVFFSYLAEPGAEVLKGVSFDLGRGELLLLEGPNGCGKSTLLKVLAGHLQPSPVGAIHLDGDDLTRTPAIRRRLVVYIDQDARRQLVGTLTVEENLALCSLGRRPSPARRWLTRRRKEQIDTVFERGELPGALLGSTPDELSGGQRQVVNFLSLFARAHLVPVVLLDEPFNNLDAAHVARCVRLIHTVQDAGSIVVAVTHSDRHLSHQVASRRCFPWSVGNGARSISRLK
jgi:putative ABC transport system permease protein